MIRLHRGPAPQELDEAEALALTNEYEATSNAVWNKGYIREALLTLSHSKCAYCEAKISEESKYMEVEHFRCKRDFPHLVVNWENLLPACKRCNGRKHDHNVDVDGMIIDPFQEDPQQHLYFQNYRLHARNELGRRTVNTLYLNQTDRIVTVRLKIGDKIAEALDAIREMLEAFIAGPQTSKHDRNRITRGMEKLLGEAQPSSEFSAVAATVLITDPNYLWIRQTLVDLDLWAPLAPLEAVANQAALVP